MGKLPNGRAKLYETCTDTLLESWREEQTERKSKLSIDLGKESKQIVTRVVAARVSGCTSIILAALCRSPRSATNCGRS